MANSGNTRNLTARFTADTSGFSPKMNELVQNLKKASAEYEVNKTKIDALKKEMKTYQTELAKIEKETKENGKVTEEQRLKMEALRTGISSCASNIGVYTAANQQLRSEINATNRELSEARTEFDNTGNAATTFGEVLKANIASEAILNGLRKIVDGLRQAASYCYSTGSAFEAGMSKVAAISGASADELETLTEKAEELGASTKFTATQTADAMSYMAMAGWKTEEMLSGIDGVLGLAAASGEDLATTSDIVTDAITAFGLTAEDCSHFSDLLASAASNANTNVALMGETFKYCAADAGSLGFSAEDTVTAIGLMANAGIKGSQAGTAMRKLFTAMSDDLTITSERLGDITIKTADASGQMRPFIDIIKDLREEFAKLTPQEQSKAATDLVGVYAQTGFKTLMNTSEEDLKKLSTAIQNCDGAAAQMAETMQDNVSGAVTKMNSALEGVGIKVFDKFKDGLLDAVNIFTDTLSGLSDDIDGGKLDESVGNLADSFRNMATEFASFVQNNLSGFINGIANVLNFIVKFRTEIAATVAGIVSFKTAMNIGSFVTRLVSSFKAVTAAIKGAEVETQAFNATMAATNPVVTLVATGVSLLISGLVGMAGHAKSASESVEELKQKTQGLTQKAQEYKQKASDLSDIKKEYDSVCKSLDPNVDRATALKEIQDKLIAQFPELASQIDLVNGAYDEMSAKLSEVADRTSEAYRVQQQSALDSAKRLQKEATTLLDNEDASKGFIELAQQLQKAKPSRKKGAISALISEHATTRGLEFTGEYEERLEDMIALYDALQDAGYGENLFTIELSKKIAEVEELNAELKEAQNNVDDLNNKSVSSSSSSGFVQTAWREAEYTRETQKKEAEKKAAEKAAQEEAEKQAALWKETYNKEKQLADDRYSVGEISEAQYYATLTALRDKYLQAYTHDWYVATAKIQSYQKKSTDSTKDQLSEMESAYKKTLDAIDDEIEKHNREKSDKEYEQKLNELNERMQYGRLDSFEKYELEKERQRLQEERAEELYSRDAADAKSSITDAYNARKALEESSANTREYTIALGDYTDALSNLGGVLRSVAQTLSVGGSSTTTSNIDESTRNVINNVVLQSVNQSNGQLLNELLKALSSRI